MWDDMRAWLEAGGAIPNDGGLKGDLCAPSYSFDAAGRLALERKEHIKERGQRSPDLADALALTFALPVAPKALNGRNFDVQGLADYDVFTHSIRKR
jgi:hypothetical protein